MCIAPHRTGEYGCCVFCFIFFTFVTVFFLASRWHHISHAGPLSLCLGGPVVVFVFAYMHLSYEDWQGLWSSVVCISYSERERHTLVCVCGCIAQTCFPARWGSFRGSESVLLHVLGEVQLFTLQTGRMNSFFFLRQDVNLYYILHLSHVIRAFLFWHLFWLVHLHLFWIHASFSNCLHHFEFTFIFRHYQVKETALCFATASASLSPLLHLCST